VSTDRLRPRLDRARPRAPRRLRRRDRVTFHERNAADAGLAGRYDLVTIFEALHDLSYPVEVLTAARNLLADGGVVLIGDERTEDEFTAPASEIERLYYGFSVFHCLPVGMVGDNAAGPGTVMRAETVRRYATDAGFASCEVLRIEHDFWRFYLVRPCARDGDYRRSAAT
jgi:hypothetical protein